MTHEEFMRLAIEEAKKGDYPYGAVIVKNGEVIAKGHNTTIRSNDPTAHAEINAIRDATAKIKKSSLEGCTLYATCEPCSMCVSACIWAGISTIVFGVSIKDILDVTEKQVNVSCEDIISKGFVDIKVVKGVLREECMKLYK